MVALFCLRLAFPLEANYEKILNFPLSGRRFNCILYGVLYSMGSLTKHFNNFHILMFGRLLAGISTSILSTAFESWLIYEHKNRGFDEQTLGIIFTNAYFGNSVVAILAGIVAQVVSNSFGYV